MTTIAKVLIAAVLAVGIGGGVAIAQASNDRDDPAGDVRGPCDEAEHANDPRCNGATTQTTRVERGEDHPRANDDRRRRRGHRGENSGRSGDSGRSGSGRHGSSDNSGRG
jgi:hypothetical protein